MRLLIIYISILAIVISLVVILTDSAEAAPPDADWSDGGVTITYGQIVDGYGWGVIGDSEGQSIIVPAEFAKGYLPVAWCESRYDNEAVGKAGERGLLQIMELHIARIRRLGFTWDQMFEAIPNALVGLDIWKDSQSWRAWSCAYAVKE